MYYTYLFVASFLFSPQSIQLERCVVKYADCCATSPAGDEIGVVFPISIKASRAFNRIVMKMLAHQCYYAVCLIRFAQGRMNESSLQPSDKHSSRVLRNRLGRISSGRGITRRMYLGCKQRYHALQDGGNSHIIGTMMQRQ